MGATAEKKRLVGGLPAKVARRRFEEIWRKEFPDGNFNEQFPKKLLKWMDIWFRLRAVNPTISQVAQAFAEKITRANKEKRALEEVIVAQRKELAKRYKEWDHRKEQLVNVAASLKLAAALLHEDNPSEAQASAYGTVSKASNFLFDMGLAVITTTPAPCGVQDHADKAQIVGG